MWYFLVGLSILFIFSGLDDLFFDVWYWLRTCRRYFKRRQYPPLTYEKLADHPEQMIAILVPCWHEANVIGTMLKHNVYSIDYQNYMIFVGVYPNDPDTTQEVQRIADNLSHVHCVMGEKPGPTNKAENLNQIYQAMCAYEKLHDMSFQIIVFHDSEDIIHPLSFKLYNYLIPRKDMIQIPIFPLNVSLWNFTHWLYADEFSENHTKNIVVRESIKAHVPSAGVGTAFSRRVIDIIKVEGAVGPFSTDSLTEDYRTSLMIRLRNFKQIFVTQHVLRMQWKPRGLLRKGYVQQVHKEMIATRAMFPTEYKKAVRQKARWIIGIVFQEWEHSPWPKEWRVRYSLSHDRKAFMTHFINGFGYLVFLFWLLYSLFTRIDPSYPSLQEQFNMHPWIWWIVVSVTSIMIERMIQRMIAVRRIYSWLPAILSIPRTFYGNVLNMHSVLRAYRVYFTDISLKKTQEKSPTWDKTEHYFPGSHVLTPFRRRLGDLLLESGEITHEQLNKAILEQQKTGDRIGQVLCKMQVMTKKSLTEWLAKQYNIGLFPKSMLDDVMQEYEPVLPKKTAKWLKKYGLTPLFVDSRAFKIKLGIEDPTNELLIEKVLAYIVPYHVQFLLIDHES
jgi:adsorption protein B